jgi:hypothetical protein
LKPWNPDDYKKDQKEYFDPSWPDQEDPVWPDYDYDWSPPKLSDYDNDWSTSKLWNPDDDKKDQKEYVKEEDAYDGDEERGDIGDSDEASELS